jgi:hypothetical protein
MIGNLHILETKFRVVDPKAPRPRPSIRTLRRPRDGGASQPVYEDNVSRF